VTLKCGSIVKVHRGLTLCPDRYVLWHEARRRSRESRNRTAAWTGAVCSTSVPLWSQVDVFGRHVFVCRKAAGRSIRHHALNELVARGLSAAAIPNTKEPQGLCRSDGKRPDGLTLVPWQSGRSLVWDVTVVCPLADSYVASAAREARSVAELATWRQQRKKTNILVLQQTTFSANCSRDSWLN